MPHRHPDHGPGDRLRPGSRPAGRRLPLLAGGMAVALLVAAACSGGSAVRSGEATGDHAAQRPGQPHSGSRGGPRRSDPAPMVLLVKPAPFQLPAGIAGAASLARGGNLMIVGGSTLARPATRSVLALDPVSGRTWAAGELAAPVTGSAGAQLAGRPVVFGGRAADAAPTMQVVPAARTAPAARSTPLPGAPPTARSGLAAVTVGETVYLLGGCGAGRFPAEVAGTRDGRDFRTVARLPVPACYAAAAAIGSRVWLFGGRTAAGPTDVIQQVDLASGTAHVIGHLPYRLAGAAAFVLNGTIYLAGGTAAASSPAGTRQAWAGPASAAVFRYEPSSGQLAVAGHLPVPVAGAAAAVIGETAYLIGGTDGRKLVPAITTLRLVRPPARPDPAAAPWLSAARGRGRLASGSQPAALPADVLIADHLNNRLVIIDPRGRLRWVFPRPHDLRRGQAFLVPDDAFFSPDGRYIIATQEDDQVISVIDVAAHRIVYRYGVPAGRGWGRTAWTIRMTPC